MGFCEQLKFKFLTHTEKTKIVEEFKKSGKGFNSIIGAVDDILIRPLKMSRRFFRDAKCDEEFVYCYRKSKYRSNIQAIVDHELKFIRIDIIWPGNTFSYLTWFTSEIHKILEDNLNSMLLPSYTIVGHNAYTKTAYILFLFKRCVEKYVNTYNFYHS